MVRYLVLINFTDEGIQQVQKSADRAGIFDAAAESVGAKVESQYWTLGSYDGAFVLSAPDEATAAKLGLALGKAHKVKTTMLRAFDAGEFKALIAGMPNLK